jgi:hypothetical protein
MRQRGAPPDVGSAIKEAVVKAVENLTEYFRQQALDELAELGNLEAFRGVREDEEPFVRRRPGRPRKIVVPGEVPTVKRPGRRPKGRKKLIREAIALRSLKRRLDGVAQRPVIVSTPSPEPELVSILPPPPVELRRRELAPPERVEWDTYPEKFGRFETRHGKDETKVTLKLYEDDRPKTRADCMTAVELANDEDWLRANPGKKPVNGKNSARPCPWVSCRNHLGINVTPSGSLQIIHDWDDGRPTCALDVVDANGPAILDTTGKFFGVTRERLRQIEVKALLRLKATKIEWEEPPEKRDNEAA